MDRLGPPLQVSQTFPKLISLQKNQVLQAFAYITRSPKLSGHQPALPQNGGMIGAYFYVPIITCPHFKFNQLTRKEK